MSPPDNLVDGASAPPRHLLARLREVLATGDSDGHDPPLCRVVRIITDELCCHVCSVYVMRPGDLIELAATEGLRKSAVGRTRLRVGEGIVGIAAATGKVLNLPDAQNHPAFAYRGEVGEDSYASLLAIPLRRAGRTQGVLVVQDREPRRYSDAEVEELQTVGMVLTEMLAAAGAPDGAEQGVASTLPRRFPGTRLVAGIAIGAVVVHGALKNPARMLADDIPAELARLSVAVAAMQRGAG